MPDNFETCFGHLNINFWKKYLSILYRIAQSFNNKYSKPDLFETYVRYGKDRGYRANMFFGAFENVVIY